MLTEKDLVGKTEEEAEITLTNEGARYRIIRRDKKSFFGTCDAIPFRFNLEIDDGYVTHVKMG